MPLREMRRRPTYRPKTKITYAYSETDEALEITERERTKHIIHFAGKNGSNNCSERTLLDQIIFREQLTDLKKGGANLQGRLPPGVKSQEGTIKRDPYDLSFLSQASAGYQSNK